jgi:hypothetical protein
MNHTYNSEACSILKILLEADAVWNFSRHILHQATANRTFVNTSDFFTSVQYGCHWLCGTSFQHFSINMWVGIIGDELAGLYMLSARLTGRRYHYFLQLTLPTTLETSHSLPDKHVVHTRWTSCAHSLYMRLSWLNVFWTLDRRTQSNSLVITVAWSQSNRFFSCGAIWKILCMLAKSSHLRTYGSALKMHFNPSVITRVFSNVCLRRKEDMPKLES